MADDFDKFLRDRGRQSRAEREAVAHRGGFLFGRNKETGPFVNVFGTRVNTDIEDAKEVDAIVRTLNVSELDEMLFGRLAKADKVKHPIMFEGDPGGGKTFTMSKYCELRHGKDAKPNVITCTPKMSELEIIGHWIPSEGGRKSASGETRAVYEAYDAASARYQNALGKLQQDLEAAGTDKERRTQIFEAFEPVRLGFEKAATEMQAHKTPDWTFKKGVLLEAYVGNGGRGRFTIVDELGLLAPNVQQIFLQAVAERGKIAPSITVHSNSGDSVYPRGEDTFFAFATNFPENTPGRSLVAAPLTDRLEWVTIPRDLVLKKENDIIKTWGNVLALQQKKNPQGQTVRVAGGLRETKHAEFSIANACGGDIVRILGDRLALFHAEYKKIVEGSPDKMRGEQRIQTLEASLRRALHTMNHIENKDLQVIGDDGMVDLEAMFRTAVTEQYINRILDNDLRNRLLGQLDSFLVRGATAKVNFRGQEVVARDALKVLKEEYARQQFAAQKGGSAESILAEHGELAAEEKFRNDEKFLQEFQAKLDKVIALAEFNHRRFCQGV